MTLELSHFTAVLVFAFFASVVFGITQKNTAQEMARYAAFCFGLFVAGTFLAGWLMAGLRYLAIR